MRFLIIALLFFAGPVFAQENDVEALFFYSPTCPHCHNIETDLDNFKKQYPQLQITKYNVVEEEGNKIFVQLSKTYNQNINGVPVVLINDKALSGDAQSTTNEIEKQIQYCSNNDCQKPSEIISSWQDNNSTQNPQSQKMTYLLVAMGIIIVFIVITFLFKEKKNND